MTQWHGADGPAVGEAGAHAAQPGPAPRRGWSRQTRLLVVAAGLLVLAAVLALVLLLVGGGSDGPPAGSPDAVTDQVAGALSGNSADRLAAASCTSAARRVRTEARRLLGHVASVEREGSATVSGDVAVARLTARTSTARTGTARSSTAGTSTGGTDAAPVTVALRRVDGTWCVDSLAVARPAR